MVRPDARPPGLEPVAGPRVVAALARSGAGNALLGFGPDRPDARPAAGLVGAPAQAETLIDAVAGRLHLEERRVAASLVVLGYAARLVGPALAVWLRDGILVDLRPERLRYAFSADQGFVLAVPEPAGWAGPDDAVRAAWSADVVDAHLAGVIAAVRGVVPIATRLLWGNVASGLTGALRTLAGDGAVPAERCHATGLALLAHPPLVDSGRLTLAAGRLRFVRRTCCLYYRIPGGGTCGDCPLTGR